MAGKTKLQILKSFSVLLADHELDKITVTMLVEECHISRQTFYYHFADIQALIDWGVQQYTHGCVTDAKKAANMEEATIIYLTKIDENKLFLRKCFSSSLSGYMTALLRNSIMEYTSEFYSQFINFGYQDSNEVDFAIEFTANGVTGFIISMLYTKTETDITTLAAKMNNYIFKRLVKR